LKFEYYGPLHLLEMLDNMVHIFRYTPVHHYFLLQLFMVRDH